MDYIKLLEDAKCSIARLPSHSVFYLKDLFRGTEWNELGKGEKLGFGRYFKKEVTEGRILYVKFVGKAANNSSKYEKE